MRSVRCDACGTKALMAASQCPKCGHLFEVRDGFGELLPLAYCSSCDSSYPASVGECRWCGTKPEPAPNHAHVWKGVGAGALVVLAVLAFLMRDSRPKHPAAPPTAKRPNVDSSYTALDTVVPVLTSVPETVSPTVTTASAGNVARVSAPLPGAPSSSPIDAVVPQAASRSVAVPIPLKKPSRASASPPSKSGTSARWVNSIAKSWVIVRADARKDARIIASVGPDTRVQLGESRGGWRRIRARGIAGWTDASAFVAIRGSARTTGLAVR